MENSYFSSHNGQEKLNDNQYGGLLFQLCLHKIKMNDEKTLNKIEMSGNQYGGFTPAPIWLTTMSC